MAEAALKCVASLLSLRLLLGDVDVADPSPISKLFAAVLSCISLGGGGDEALELADGEEARDGGEEACDREMSGQDAQEAVSRAGGERKGKNR